MNESSYIDEDWNARAGWHHQYGQWCFGAWLGKVPIARLAVQEYHGTAQGRVGTQASYSMLAFGDHG